MALPMNSTPVYNLTVPSTNKEIKYRPFLVKEEKALLIAMQSEDPVVMMDTLKSVVASCAPSLDVDQLATFDIEYIFTQLRAKSVGEIVDLSIKCDDCEDERAVANVSVDLTKLKVIVDPDHNKNIHLFDDVHVSMKYPTIDVFKDLEAVSTDDIDAVFNVIVECIESIYTTDEVFYAKEQSKDEMIEFLNNLTAEQFDKIQQFFESVPKLRHEVSYSCPLCNKEHTRVLEGLTSFF